MCYSVEPRERRYVKGYGFLSIAKYTDKNLNNKYSHTAKNLQQMQ